MILTATEMATVVPLLAGVVLGMLGGGIYVLWCQSRDLDRHDKQLADLWEATYGNPDEPHTAPIVLPPKRNDGADTVESDPLDMAARKDYLNARPAAAGRHRREGKK